jgi:hypothetical protein
MNWTSLAITVCSKRRIARHVSQPEIGARGTGNHCAMCSIHWTRGGTNVLLGRPRRQGDGRLTADRLIPMGVWRDSFAATI